MIEFIRSQVEPEVKDDETSPVDCYGHTRRVWCYKPGFSGMPLVLRTPNGARPFVLDHDGGRVELIGA